jgi:hypothetical protein
VERVDNRYDNSLMTEHLSSWEKSGQERVKMLAYAEALVLGADMDC